MIVEKDFLNKLKDFGLNAYESKLWTALLSRGISTAGELSDIASVPRSRSYDVLESLEKKGFIISKLGKPIKYIAVPPEESIERVKRRIESESMQRLNIISKLQQGSILTELSSLHDKGISAIEPLDLSGSIKDRANIDNHLESRFRSAKKSIHIMTTAARAEKKVQILISLKDNLKEGVKVKLACPNIPSSLKGGSQTSDIIDVRQVPVNSRFCIIDGREVIFMLMDDGCVHPSYDTAIWVNSSFFAQTLDSIFLSKWN